MYLFKYFVFLTMNCKMGIISRINFSRSNRASLEKMNFFYFTEVSAEVRILSAGELVSVFSRRWYSFMVFLDRVRNEFLTFFAVWFLHFVYLLLGCNLET